MIGEKPEYFLGKCSKDRWQFEKEIEGCISVSFISSTKPTINELKSKLKRSEIYCRKYHSQIEKLVAKVYEDNHQEIRKALTLRLDSSEHANRLCPHPGTQGYETFDESDLFNIVAVHLMPNEEYIIIELVMVWDDGMLVKCEGDLVTLEHEITQDDLYVIDEIEFSNQL